VQLARGAGITIHTSYTDARAHLADLWDQATQQRETIIITRRGAADVALIAAGELASLQVTAHLLRSPANTVRLMLAITRALADDVEPSTVEALAEEVGLARQP
jgi:antitoxin YefM